MDYVKPKSLCYKVVCLVAVIKSIRFNPEVQDDYWWSARRLFPLPQMMIHAKG